MSPDQGLDKWLKKECKDLGIENVKEKKPIVRT
jgi:hypothetical protein